MMWCRWAAVVPIRALAWEFPNAAGAALKRQKKTEKKNHLLKSHFELICKTF